MKVPVKVTDKDGEKVVGIFDRETNTFEKTVDESHKMRMYGGSWGLDVGVLNKLVKANSDIILNYPEGVLMTTAKRWKELAIEADHGYGLQSFLQEKSFQ